MGLTDWIPFTKDKTNKDQGWSTSKPGPLQYARKDQPPTIGTQGLLQGYSDMPWLHAVASKVSGTVGQTSWRLYRVSDQRGRATQNHRLKHMTKENRDQEIVSKARLGNLEEIESHPLLDFLFEGNEFLDGTAALRVTQIHLDLAGEAFWVIERNGVGGPVAWYPVPPHWVKEFPNPESDFYKFDFPTGERKSIHKVNVIHFVQPDPENPYGRGVGTGQALGDELEIDEYSSKFVKSHFYNNARPDLIISAENMSEPEARRLDKQWKQEHQGFFKAFKPIFMSKKVDVKELGQNFEHLQLVSLKEQERDTIISVFGVSPEMVGVIEDSNKASIDAASYFYSKFAIEPRQEQLRTALQKKLVPMFDSTLILDYDSIVPEDKERKKELMSAAPWAYTVDEWRAEAGKDPLPNGAGQARMLPLNEVQVGLDEAPPKPENGDQNMQLEEFESVKEQVKQKHPEFNDALQNKVAMRIANKKYK